MIVPAFACATSARERDDPLAGTATTATRFLLIEHPGPWAFDAFAGSGIDLEVRVALTAAVRSVRSRLLLIRRPGRQDLTAPRRWAVLDSRPEGGDVWGTWETDQDLLAAIEALNGRGGPVKDTSTVLLVCAHGRHDACCAVRGRPVAAALQQRWPDETWECSHVGGDRFAANVIVLPSDTYYGNLDAANAVRVVTEHLAGRVPMDFLRGFGTESPVAQSAIAEAHRRYGPAGPRDVVSSGTEQIADDLWQVYLGGTGAIPRTLVAHVRAVSRPAALLTCQAHMQTAARGYVVQDLHEPSTHEPEAPWTSPS